MRSTTVATACAWPTEGAWDTDVSATPAMKVRSGTCKDFMVLYLFMKTALVILLIELFGDLISYKPFIALGERYGNRMHDKTLLDKD